MKRECEGQQINQSRIISTERNIDCNVITTSGNWGVNQQTKSQCMRALVLGSCAWQPDSIGRMHSSWGVWNRVHKDGSFIRAIQSIRGEEIRAHAQIYKGKGKKLCEASPSSWHLPILGPKLQAPTLRNQFP
jgi:hypothetical protein